MRWGFDLRSANGMKLSKGQMGARLLGLAEGGVALAASGAASAELGQPAPWEYRLQEAATPVMENITWFHNFLLVLITVITLFVLGLLVAVVIKFNAIPGRLNETWFKATKTGMFYGQCSELCGKDHAFMPIAVRVVSDQEFASWVEEAKKKYASTPGNAYASAAGAAQ